MMLKTYGKTVYSHTHSNCRAICSFPRNLTDDQLRVIGERGGIVGLNMCVDFLSDSGKAGIEDVIRHTEHMLDICGENSVALGCDFDGIPITPDGIENVARIEYVLESMEKSLEKDNGKNSVRQFYQDNRYAHIIMACICIYNSIQFIHWSTEEETK